MEKENLKDLDTSTDDDDELNPGTGKSVNEETLAQNLEPMDAANEEQGSVVVDLSGKEPEVARTPKKEAGETTDKPGETDIDVKSKDDDPDEEAYSANVRKRIERERRLKTEERNARIAAEKDATDARRELAKLKAEKETSIVDTEIDDLKIKLKAAKHALDHDEEVEITDKLQKANVKRAALERSAETKDAQKGKGKAEADSDGEPELHPLAKQWYSRNDW
ncbi:MAG: hypothetical protein ACRD2L_07345, partial [Terriglobia bacterium]